jgi:hypothetical protein
MKDDQQKDSTSGAAKIGNSNLIYHNYGGLAGAVNDWNEGEENGKVVDLEIEKAKIIMEDREEKDLKKETEKTIAFFERYKNLPEEVKKEITNSQKSAEEIIGRYIKGEKDISGLSEEERFVLNKIRNEYREFKKSEKGESFSFDLANEIDKAIYSNLLYDISFRLLGLESPIKREKQSSLQSTNFEPKTKTEIGSKTEIEVEIETETSSVKEMDGLRDLEEAGSKIIPGSVVEIAPRGRGELEQDANTKILTIDYLRNKVNTFGLEDAEDVMAIVRDWLYYGGDFYKHWTGRALKLKRGVDYQINSDGTDNQDSYIRARNKMVEEWLKQPVNRAWIAEANEFKNNNSDKISDKKQKVEFKDQKGRIREEERYTTPYFYEGEWLFYDSNYFSLSNGAMMQREKEPSKYRIYFNMENQDVLRVFSDIVSKLSTDQLLSRVGFTISTIAIFDPTAEIIAEAINQKDKIILMVGDKGIDRTLQVLQEYILKNRAKFDKNGILLAQKFFGRDGKEIPGISISSDVKGVSPDSSRGFPKYRSFNAMQVEIIQSALNSIFKDIYNFDNLDKIGLINPQLRDHLLEIGHDGKLEDYLALFMSQQSGLVFLIKNLVRFYPKWGKAFSMSAKNIAFREEEK